MIGGNQKPGGPGRPPEMDEPLDRREQLTTADIAASNRATSQAGAGVAPRFEEPRSGFTGASSPNDETVALLDDHETEDFRSRWERIQTGFVDDPRVAVEQADKLVAALMSRLAEVFADERGNLEQEWARGEDVSTEDLRVALRRYRSFFDRLLSV